MTLPSRLLAGSAALALSVLLDAPAYACGGFFCMNQPIDQSGERILFIQDGGQVTAHVQINYQGDARKFSWVVPTPTKPTLGVGSEALFREVDEGTRPRFQLNIKDQGDCYWPPNPPGLAEDRMSEAAPMQKSGVQVVSQEQIGPYDSAVIKSDDPDALRRWLKDNGYILPAKLDPLLNPYVAGKYYFVALKLQQDRGAGDLQPIVLHYAATKPGIPIRLTGVAATPDMDIYVWVLGDDRAVPENYRHAVINETQVDWLSGGSNYKQVVTRAVDEAGGQAFVTDFAGRGHGVDLAFFRGDKWNLDRLSHLHDPVQFLRAIQEEGYFERGSSQAMAFVKRYVPIPSSMKDVWAPSFYSNPEEYRTQLRREGVRVDSEKAAKELEETVVKPAREIQAAFTRHHYLTRLYTTMSPEEMTQDPTFRFNAYLPPVDNFHAADGTRDCTHHRDGATAPIRVALKDGTHFTIYPNANNGPRPYPIEERPSSLPPLAEDGHAPPVQAMPAALRIEQLPALGPASVIQDNRAAIEAVLAPAPKAAAAPSGGMACSRTEDVPGTEPRPREGSAGEPATYALMLAAWRYLSRRRRR